MDKTLAQLEDVLREEAAAHERLLATMDQKLDAMRNANREQLAACCRAENELVQAIGEHEKQRLTLVAVLTQTLDPRAVSPLRMGELAERLPEPARGRLLVLRAQLRERIEAVRSRGGTLRRAADGLLAHMSGLMQAVSGALSDTGTYGRRGATPTATMAVSTFSTTA